MLGFDTIQRVASVLMVRGDRFMISYMDPKKEKTDFDFKDAALPRFDAGHLNTMKRAWKKRAAKRVDVSKESKDMLQKRCGEAWQEIKLAMFLGLCSAPASTKPLNFANSKGDDHISMSTYLPTPMYVVQLTQL